MVETGNTRFDKPYFLSGRRPKTTIEVDGAEFELNGVADGEQMGTVVGVNDAGKKWVKQKLESGSTVDCDGEGIGLGNTQFLNIGRYTITGCTQSFVDSITR